MEDTPWDSSVPVFQSASGTNRIPKILMDMSACTCRCIQGTRVSIRNSFSNSICYPTHTYTSTHYTVYTCTSVHGKKPYFLQWHSLFTKRETVTIKKCDRDRTYTMYHGEKIRQDKKRLGKRTRERKKIGQIKQHTMTPE